MEETRTRFWAAMPASRSASSKDVSRSRCFPTPLVKKIRLGTMSLDNSCASKQPLKWKKQNLTQRNMNTMLIFAQTSKKIGGTPPGVPPVLSTEILGQAPATELTLTVSPLTVPLTLAF